MALFSKKQTDQPRRRQAEIRSRGETADEFAARYTFSRNRTLTGSASSAISSINEQNAHIKSPRVHAHDLARQRRRLGAVLMLVIAAIGILGGLISQFTAEAVVRSTDMAITLDKNYAKDIQGYFDRQPIERLRFLLNETHLTEYLQSVAPEVSSVRADDSAGLGKTAFVVKVRKPIVGWTMNGQQQYVDASGTAFARNYYAEPAVQVVDDSGIKTAPGQTVASNRFLGFVGRIVGLASSTGYTVNQVILPRGTTREVDIRMNDVSYPVRFSADRPAGEQVEDMSRAVGWLRARDQNPQYLDVRVSRRAYYQ